MIYQLRSALDSSIADLTDFLWIELGPFFPMEFLKDLFHISHIDKIDESIANITIILN